MYEAMMIAATGLQNQQRRLDSIADNLANVNTVAHKSSRLDFKDALYTAGISPGPPRTPAPEGNQQKGHGVIVAAVSKDYKGGALMITENQLDLAIEGEGFFELEGEQGGSLYTRNGAFRLGEGGDGFYLVNGEGHFVRDADGNRIRVPDETSSIAVGNDGTAVFMSGEQQLETTTLGVYTFRNITGLMSAGGSNYAETEASGERRPAEEAVVRQGALEGSNVSLADEMTRMMRTQRAFSLASRALKTADDMEGIANSIRR